ncbi:thioredoxin [Calothrix sp. NIES-4101]|nr:thioredoxin [Calothrix sp. NIES-4101]
MSEIFSIDQTFLTGKTAFKWLMQESDRLIILKFVAPHCPGCKTLKPVLNQIAQDCVGKLNLVEIDMTEEPEIAMNFGVRSAPTVVLLKGHEILANIGGLQPKNSIYRKFINF